MDARRSSPARLRARGPPSLVDPSARCERGWRAAVRPGKRPLPTARPVPVCMIALTPHPAAEPAPDRGRDRLQAGPCPVDRDTLAGASGNGATQAWLDPAEPVRGHQRAPGECIHLDIKTPGAARPARPPRHRNAQGRAGMSCMSRSMTVRADAPPVRATARTGAPLSGGWTPRATPQPPPFCRAPGVGSVRQASRPNACRPRMGLPTTPAASSHDPTRPKPRASRRGSSRPSCGKGPAGSIPHPKRETPTILRSGDGFNRSRPQPAFNG